MVPHGGRVSILGKHVSSVILAFFSIPTAFIYKKKIAIDEVSICIVLSLSKLLYFCYSYFLVVKEECTRHLFTCLLPENFLKIRSPE